MEQQRNLGATAPSLYDLRNLFQVNVEEGRHLWAMVYLLHAYFGREGREEAEELLHRNSGSEDSPRILGAFNEETPDWLSFFMFTYFTDRDGKYQLGTLKESAFDPLSPDLRVHAQGRGAPHDGRHHRGRPGGGADRAGDGGERHRRRRRPRRDPAAGHPEVPQLPLQRLARPVRRRDLDQRRQLLHRRPEGPLAGGAPQGRPHCSPRLDHGGRARSTGRSRRPRWPR